MSLDATSTATDPCRTDGRGASAKQRPRRQSADGGCPFPRPPVPNDDASDGTGAQEERASERRRSEKRYGFYAIAGDRTRVRGLGSPCPAARLLSRTVPSTVGRGRLSTFPGKPRASPQTSRDSYRTASCSPEHRSRPSFPRTRSTTSPSSRRRPYHRPGPSPSELTDGSTVSSDAAPAIKKLATRFRACGPERARPRAGTS